MISSRLHPQLFLRFDKIEPGDVLLTRGGDRESFLISIGTASLFNNLVGNGFSHAALWLPHLDEATRRVTPHHVHVLLAEADEFGVGTTGYPQKHVQLRGGEHIPAIPIFDAVRARLLRHPAAKTVPQEAMLAASTWLTETEFFKAYSLQGRLADAAHYYSMLQLLLRKKLAARDVVDEEMIYGVFCSELVGKFFERLGLPLFSNVREANRISPNDLNNSQLVEVHGAVLSPADIVFSDVASMWHGNLRSSSTDRAEHLAPMVRWYSGHAAVKKSIAEFTDGATQGIRDDLRRHAAMSRDRLSKIVLAISCAQLWGQDEVLPRLWRYRDMALISLYLQQALLRNEPGSQQSDGLRNFTPVELEVNTIALKLDREVAESFLRTFNLMSLRQARRIKLDEFEPQRARMLKAWMSDRSARATLGKLIDQMNEFTRTDRSEEFYREVWQYIRSSILNATSVGGSPDESASVV